MYLEEKYLDSVDKGYIIGSLREKLLQHGALLVPAAEGSDITIEIRSGGVGTDSTERFVGVPGMALPGPIPFEMPEVRLYEKSSQFGTAKLGIVGYATATGQIVFDGGRQLARADDSRWAVMGVGPFESGTVRTELHRGTAQVASGELGTSIR